MADSDIHVWLHFQEKNCENIIPHFNIYRILLLYGSWQVNKKYKS
jgi:hypothetical protein